MSKKTQKCHLFKIPQWPTFEILGDECTHQYLPKKTLSTVGEFFVAWPTFSYQVSPHHWQSPYQFVGQKNASFPADHWPRWIYANAAAFNAAWWARDGVGDWVRKLNSLIRAGQGRGLSLIWGMPDSTHPPGALPRVIRPWSPKLPR